MLRKAMRESALIAPPTFEVGDRVTASFEGHIKRYAGTVRAFKKLGPTARPLYDVDFDDGEFWPDIGEGELQPGPSLQTIAEELRAKRPSAEQLSAAKEKLQDFTLPNCVHFLFLSSFRRPSNAAVVFVKFIVWPHSYPQNR